MTNIKLCGIRRQEDIVVINAILPEYIGFVFAENSKRYVSPEQAADLKANLASNVSAVGVFTDENPKTVAALLNNGIIDMAQLHGNEGEDYIAALRNLTDKPLMKAFQIHEAKDLSMLESSSADYVLADSGAGSGAVLNWSLLSGIQRPYFLAGGLSPDNVSYAIEQLHPFAVDVSSGIETDGWKDTGKMKRFVTAVRRQC